MGTEHGQWPHVVERVHGRLLLLDGVLLDRGYSRCELRMAVRMRGYKKSRPDTTEKGALKPIPLCAWNTVGTNAVGYAT